MKSLYLGRRDNLYKRYQLGTVKKDWQRKDGFDYSIIDSFCPTQFEKHTTIRMNGKPITLAPGELVKVKSIVFEVEEVK